MRATRQDGRGHRLGLWQGLGLVAAVIAAAGLTYTAMSSAFNAQSRPSAVAVQASIVTTDPSDLGNVIPGGSSIPTVPGAKAPATVPPTSTKTPAAAPKSPTSKPTGAAGKGKTGSGTAQTGTGSASAGASLAGRLKPGETRQGVATFYQGAQNTGACSFDRSPDHLTAAMNWKDYEGSNACGAYVQVRGSSGATITIRITNLCPSPCRVGQLDLDPEAYKLLAPLQTGETPITWKLVSPNISGGIAIRYKTGSSQWWCGIQVINHRNPVARLEVKVASGWKVLPRAEYNYFLSDQGSGCGGQIRITDIYGQRLTVGALPIRADVTQQTSLQFAKH
jgi:expansin (peptidoglycan-binding protein)